MSIHDGETDDGGVSDGAMSVVEDVSNGDDTDVETPPAKQRRIGDKGTDDVASSKSSETCPIRQVRRPFCSDII